MTTTMKQLTYYVAPALYDKRAYSIRGRRRKDVAERLADTDAVDPEDYGPIKKVSVQYGDAFDLLAACLGEDGGWWESD